MKKLSLSLLAGLALVLVLVAAGYVYLRSAEPDHGRGAALPGLTAPVEVWRDSLGVPHLWASSEADLFRAMGYVHAQDRLWQMELFRRVADGRLAEVLGEDLVKSDRFLRTVGMGRAAAENERMLSAEERRLMQAYADGVNTWIRGHEGALPPEFVALRFRPEPWEIRHSMAIAKIMAWDLASWEIGLELQRAMDLVGPELGRELFPDYPEWGAHILEGATPVGGRSGTACLPGVPLPEIDPRALELLDGASIARASNAWVIGGERTRSGKPILANDMHLALRAPSLWYLAALHGGELNVAGMTLPGVPVVIAGHSAGVAWGFTNAMVDDVDFFVEQVDPQDATRYRTPSGWDRFAVREETIQVKGGDPVVHRVRASRHGPVISDVDERGGERVLAMRWTAHDPSPEYRALLGMNRAANAGEFLTALRDFRNPHQNVVFADTAGRYGYWMGGRVPVRASGDGLLPVPGWTGEGEWERFLAFDEHPHALQPEAGYVVTANNRQVGPEYPHHITRWWAEPYRAMRIREMVEPARDLTARDVARQQMDVVDLHARRYLPHAVRAAETAGEGEAASTLRTWNSEARMDSHAAALFYSWYEQLRRRVGEDEYGGASMYFPRYALDRVLDEGTSAWVDDVRTERRETLEELSAAAMREAVRSVGGRSWGELHPTHIDHPLGASALLDRVLGLNLSPFPRAGSPHTVDVAGYGGTEPPFTNRYGASQRHVVDLADPDGAGGFVIPTGQSGLPFSRHYDDQTPLWREGRLWRIPLERSRAEARTVTKAVLRPR